MPTFLRDLVLGAVLVLTAGCASFLPRPLSPSETASAFEARTLDSPDLKKFLETNLQGEIEPWPPRVWDFRLLTLAAYYYHPDLDVARAQWGVARARIVTAGARPNPSLQIVPEFSVNPPAGVSPWTVGPLFDIPVETAGKRGYRIAQAQHLSAAARRQIAVAAWRVRSRLRRSLLDLYSANKREILLLGQDRVQADMVMLLEKRLAYGKISRPVVTQAQISLERTRLSLQENRRRIGENRVRVAEALGLPAGALRNRELSLAVFENFPERLPSRNMTRQALLCRPDILSGLADYEATQSALQLEIARQYPDLRLLPGYRFDEGENKWSFGFSLVLPLLNRNEGPIAEAEARRLEASARFMALQARVLGEIERGGADYSRALQKLGVAKALYDTQKKQDQSARARFQMGEVDRLAELSARLELLTSDLSRLDALAEAQKFLGLLEDALWRPLQPPESSPPPPETNLRGEDGR